MKNTKRALRILSALTLTLMMMCGTSLNVFAAADTSSLDFNKKGSITLSLYSDEANTAVTDGALTLYEVAELYLEDGDMAYRYTDEFAGCDASLGDVTAASLAVTFAQYAQDNDLTGDQTKSANVFGQVKFNDLSLGLYLVIQTTQSEGYYIVDPFIVTVPLADTDTWIYNVDASPKVELYQAPVAPETQGEKETEAPETLPAGTGTETQANPPAGSNTETQAIPPTGSSVVIPATPDAPVVYSTLPQTGQLNWPIPVLTVCGLLLICMGRYLTHVSRRRNNAA